MEKQFKNGVLNIICGIGGQAFILILGLIIPRLVIVNYGSDLNGMLNTVSQIFTYMALLEAGISTSARNALYRPVRENNKEEISDVMSMAKTYYNKITFIYALIVIGLCFFLPFVLKTEVNYWTIFAVVFFDGAINVVSFFFVQKWITLLNVVGKNYIVNIINVIYKTLCSLLKITLASFCIDIAIIEAGYFTVSLIQLLLYYFYMSRHYSWINYNSDKKNEKFRDRNSFVLTEIAWTIFSSTDMIILSIFVSTKLSSVYAIYNMVFVALNGLLTNAYQSVTYILGQRYAAGISEYTRIHDLFNSIFMSAITILMSVTYWLIIPFVKLYTNGITDINYIYQWLPLLFCLVQILSWTRYVSGNLSGLAGYAKQTSIISMIEAITNVVLSVVFVNFWGITGVLLATVIALPLKVVFLLILSEKKILKRKLNRTIMIMGINYAIFFLTVIIKSFIPISIDGYLAFSGYGLCLTIIYAVVTLLMNSIVNKDFGRRIFHLYKH